MFFINVIDMACVRGSPIESLIGNMFTSCTNLITNCTIGKEIGANGKMLIPLVQMVQKLPTNGEFRTRACDQLTSSEKWPQCILLRIHFLERSHEDSTCMWFGRVCYVGSHE